ncbi:MAG: hypothetical protein RLZZ306_446 [Bacteroidota bacterium]
MSKCLNFSLKYLIMLSIIGIFNSCSSNSKEAEDKQYQTIYQSLKDNQTKFVVKLDGNDFYSSESIFSGHLEMLLGSFTMNYFDQFDSNVMIHFGGEKWYKARPITTSIKLDNGFSSNVMIGKIINKKEKLGAGYLMSAGIITFKVFTKEKFVIVIEGKAKKYPKTDANDTTYDIKAIIVSKNPKFDVVDIDGKASFYGN